jgi:alpha-beta hydrolase superfamily lysophospholipase
MGHGDSKGDHPMNFVGADDASGWECACEDAYYCIQKAKENYGECLPVYGIGFSLGSFIIRTLAIDRPSLFKAIVLIGTGDQNAIELSISKHIAKSECEKHGFTQSTPKIHTLTFGKYNKSFENATQADWLCANKTALFEYLNDDACGKSLTSGLFYELIRGMEFVGKQRNIDLMNKRTQVLMLSGNHDPVGNFTKGVIKLQRKFQRAGLRPIVKFYDWKRHDILHEDNQDEVRNDIINFLLHN